MRRQLLISFFLAAITIAVFSPAFKGQFLQWDDDINITHNPHIQKLNSENLRWMFTDYTFVRRYVPMGWLTWAATSQVCGLNPRAFHIEGVLLHTLNVLLLFFLLNKVLASAFKTNSPNQTLIPAALAALIWAIHPLRVEVVAWANCQLYSQSLLFLLLSLFVYWRAATKKSGTLALILFSTFLFLLSLLTYPTGIAFVVVLFVIDIFLLHRLPTDPRRWWGRNERRVLFEKLPFIFATLFVAGITLWARGHLNGFWKMGDRLADFGWAARIAQAFYIWAYYLWKPWCSANWSPVYTQLLSFHYTDLPFVLSAVGVTGLTILFFFMRKRWPWALALWICHLALLLPMLGLTEHPHYPNDRYSYIVSILFTVAIALVLAKVWSSVPRRLFAATAVCVCLMAFSVMSFRQTKTWQDNVTLFASVIDKLGSDPYRADLYWRLGHHYVAERQFDEARSSFASAINANPNLPRVYQDLADTLMKQHKLNEAETNYLTAIRLGYETPAAHYQLGVIYSEQHQPFKAILHWRAALRAQSNWVEALNNLSWLESTCPDAYARDGADALGLAQLALAISGDGDPDTLDTLAAALAENGKFDEAIRIESRALSLLMDKGRDPKPFSERLRLYESRQPYREAL